MRKKSAKYSIPFFRSMLLRSMGPSLVILIVCVIFFSLLFGMVAKNANEGFVANQREKLSQRLKDVEQQVLRIDYSQKELINSNDFSKLAYMYDDFDWYTRYQLQNEMQKKLWSICNTNDLVQGAYLVIPGIDKVISDKKVNAPLPGFISEALAETAYTSAGDDDTILNISYRFDDTAEFSAAMAVLLDRKEITKQLEYALTAGDSIILSVAGSSEAPESANLLSSSLLPLTVEYIPGGFTAGEFTDKIFFLCGLFVIIAILAEIIGLILWYKHTYAPLYTLLIEAFGKAEEGDYSYRITSAKNSAFADVFTSFNHMMEKTESYVETNLKQQILVSKANLKQLQSQISPHFMYNSYYVLYRLIKKGDQEGSLKLAEHLGQFYQYVTRNADDEKHLDEEVAHARNYAAIQKFRFRDAIDISIDDPDESIAKTYVPRLILQPLLENVFKYAYDAGNAALNDEGIIRLRIRYDVESSSNFQIIVENSGNITDDAIAAIQDKLSSTDKNIETTALINIHRRLKIYFGQLSGLSVERSPLGGLMVRMKICKD